MKLSVSNIAWNHDEAAAILPRLASLGVRGIETAPANVSLGFAKDEDFTAEATAWKALLDAHGLAASAIQGVLAGGSGYALSGDDPVPQPAIVARINSAARFAGMIGARPIVFGAPGLRRDPHMLASAKTTLIAMARAAEQYGCRLCFEPNSAIYGCRFGRTHDEAALIAREISSGLQFDLAAALLEDKDIHTAVMRHMPRARHAHISEPDLAPIGSIGFGHHKIAAGAMLSLIEEGETLPEWLSIEMRRPDGDSPLSVIETSIGRVQTLYRKILS